MTLSPEVRAALKRFAEPGRQYASAAPDPTVAMAILEIAAALDALRRPRTVEEFRKLLVGELEDRAAAHKDEGFTDHADEASSIASLIRSMP